MTWHQGSLRSEVQRRCVLRVAPILPDLEIQNSEGLENKGFFLDSGFSSYTVPTFYHSHYLRLRKIQKISGKLFLEGRKVQKGSRRVSESFRELREEAGSARGVFPNVWKPQNDTGRLGRFGRSEISETRKVQESHKEEYHWIGSARCS